MCVCIHVIKYICVRFNIGVISSSVISSSDAARFNVSFPCPSVAVLLLKMLRTQVGKKKKEEFNHLINFASESICRYCVYNSMALYTSSYFCCRIISGQSDAIFVQQVTFSPHIVLPQQLWELFPLQMHQWSLKSLLRPCFWEQ